MSQSAASMPPPGNVTRAVYLAWRDQQPKGRFERIGGEVVSIASERVEHARAKPCAANELARALKQAVAGGEALPDSVCVRVGGHRVRKLLSRDPKGIMSKSQRFRCLNRDRLHGTSRNHNASRQAFAG